MLLMGEMEFLYEGSRYRIMQLVPRNSSNCLRNDVNMSSYRFLLILEQADVVNLRW